MEMKILSLIDGARAARGLTVIIDVFRAFSLECYLASWGAAHILPVGDMDKALAWKREDPDRILIGERGGRRAPGCDFGNSPSQVQGTALAGKTVIHTTGAGTQGIAAATGASELLTGSLVNAAAVAAYIRGRQPDTVSLVTMGNGGVQEAEEDVVCAEYIRSLVLGEPYDIAARVRALRTGGGAHFFLPNMQDVFPQADFFMCTDCNRFPFVLHVERDDQGRQRVRREG